MTSQTLSLGKDLGVQKLVDRGTDAWAGTA